MKESSIPRGAAGASLSDEAEPEVLNCSSRKCRRFLALPKHGETKWRS